MWPRFQHVGCILATVLIFFAIGSRVFWNFAWHQKKYHILNQSICVILGGVILLRWAQGVKNQFFLGRWCSFHNVFDFLKTFLSLVELSYLLACLGCHLSFRTKLEGNFYFCRRFPDLLVFQKLFENWLQLQLECWLIVGGRANWVLKVVKMYFF